MKQALASAAASQRREKDVRKARQEDRDPGLRPLTTAFPSDVARWLEQVRTREDENGRHVANEKQFEAIQLIASRVVAEMNGQ
eukprot:16449823-Heterocapsa_arctica.AAC.1